ncbi:hypothetical protein FBULB1_7934 [Fusarium bulbicola]|nr:hypothetical protein FBULB1_7934 [Fusarium bulbicola]
MLQLKGEGKEEIYVSDVICWAITETCLDLKRAIPLWLTQGVRSSKQQDIWSRLSDNDTKPDEFLEEEGQSLKERCVPQKGLTDLSSLTQGLNDSIAKEWTAEGSFPESSTAFRTVMEPAFQSLSKTLAAVHFDVKEFPETVWVSMDFAHTVKGVFSGKSYSDSYQRPVQWVLSGKNEEGASGMAILSPFAAQYFLPLVEESEHVTLHLYAPRVNLSFGPLGDLQLYSVRKKVVEEIPRDIITFLNLFAGQLYFSSYDDYKFVCDLLGLAWDAVDDGAASDGLSESVFTKGPAAFLKELLEKVRQDCGTIDKTDIRRAIEGVRLVEGNFNSRHGL